jgi:hypothetical protein
MLRRTLAALRVLLRRSLGGRPPVRRGEVDPMRREPGQARVTADAPRVAHDLVIDREVTMLRDRAAEIAEAALAKERARQLLMESLTPEQWRQYRSDRHFDVIGGESGKRYRLWHCYQQNIEELDEAGNREWIWCFHPNEPLAVEDVLLAQKTALELFEGDALAIARGYWDFAPNSGPRSVMALRDFHGMARRPDEEMVEYYRHYPPI